MFSRQTSLGLIILDKWGTASSKTLKEKIDGISPAKYPQCAQRDVAVESLRLSKLTLKLALKYS